MKLQIFASLSMVASALAQGVTEHPAPTGKAPEGCSANSNGMFTLSTAALPGNAKRDSALDVCHPSMAI
jgi:hypothetical protein